MFADPYQQIDTEFEAVTCPVRVIVTTSTAGPAPMIDHFVVVDLYTAEASCEERPPARVPPWVPKKPWWQR